MAVRMLAVLAASFAAHASAAGCSNAGPMLEMVIDISHACFDHCPQLCEPLDDIITGFLMTGSKSEMREKICASKDQFDCVFDPDIVDECRKVLSMGSTIGAHMPT